MEQNHEDNAPATETTEAAPVRRRASRRVSAAAGAAAEVVADAAVTQAEAPKVAEAPKAAEAPKEAAADTAEPVKTAPKRASRSRKKVEPVEAAEAAAPEAAAEAAVTQAPAKTKKATASEAADAAQTAEGAEKPAEAPKKRTTRACKVAAEPVAEVAAEQAAAPANDTPAEPTAPVETPEAKPADEAPAADAEAAPARRSRRRANQVTEQNDSEESQQNDDSKQRGRGGNQNNGAKTETKTDAARGDAAKSEAAKGDAAKADAAKAEADKQHQSDRGDANRQDNSARSSRTRQRDRKRRGGDDLEPEISEDDVLLPVAGILDVLDNYAFVRTSGYLPGVSDVYVALGQVKKYSLRRGDAIVGAIRQPREGDSGGRQKYNAIVKIDSVNGKPVEETEQRPEITEMTPVFPQQRLKLDASADRALGRAIDAVAPIGLGQRGILVLPEQLSGSEVVRELAADISANAPDTHLMVVLSDAQPEVATELSRTISGEVVAATFDRLPEDQTTISELGIDRARRLVELGHDVVVLVDSLNRLARGYAQSQQPTARPALGAIDEHAIFQIKCLLAAARNVENGGSLTVLATVRAENGNEADTLLLREVRGVVNSVIEFDASSTIEAPVLNVHASRTQHLSAMLDAKELAAVAANRKKQLSSKTSAK